MPTATTRMITISIGLGIGIQVSSHVECNCCTISRRRFKESHGLESWMENAMTAATNAPAGWGNHQKTCNSSAIVTHTAIAQMLTRV